jgi:hypothetical protein
MKKLILLYLIPLFILPISTVYSQSVAPSVALSKAWAAYHQGNFGNAYQQAYSAWNDNGRFYPEANYLIGLIYSAQGQHALSQQYYERAINEAGKTPERIPYHYGLAYSYLAQKDYPLFLSVLQGIEALSVGKDVSATLVQQRQQASAVMYKEGLSRVLEIYRWQDNGQLTANRLLAMAYYTDGRNDTDFTLSTQLFLFVIDSRVTTLLQHMTRYRPDYQFVDLSTLLKDIQPYADMRQFLSDSDFYRDLYLLGCAVHQSTGHKVSKTIWNWVRHSSDAKEWQKRAQLQFDKPFKETYTMSIEDFALPAKS